MLNLTFNMHLRSSTYGTAVFLRTDTFVPIEHPVTFKTLEEMMLLCGTPRENMTLEKVVLHQGEAPKATSTVTLGFIAAMQKNVFA